MKPTTKPNIQMISDITGFSPATISNALNNRRGVKKETSERIFGVAKELGYINQAGFDKIRFVVYRLPGSDFAESPVLPMALRGAERACIRAGFEVAVNYYDITSNSYQQELDALLNDRTQGIVIMGSELVESEIDKFKASNLPLVFIDYWSDDMDLECLVNNARDSVGRIVEYLLKKGHTKIGYIRSQLRSYPFREREEALRASLEKAGHPLEEKYVCPVGVSTNSSYASMQGWLATGPELPTAFFADNDFMAMGAMRAMKEAGIRLPEDVSLIGFDNVPISELVTPSLTTVHVEMELLGEIAAQKIISIIQNPSRPKSKEVVATSFVERDSVADMPASKQ